jgi:subtilisin family serine protease
MYCSVWNGVVLGVLTASFAVFAYGVSENPVENILSSVSFDRNTMIGEVSAVLKTHAAADIIVTLVQPDPPSQSKNLNKAQYRAAMRAANHAASEKVLAALEATEFTEQYRFDNFAGFSGTVKESGFKKLLAHPSVLYVEPVRILESHIAQGIPLMNATTVRTSYNGSGMAIAVCDTGIDYTHPRLGNGSFPNAKVLGGYDFGDSDANPAPDPSQAHGTCCAGITAGDLGTVGDYIGGVAYNAKLYALKISYGTSGSATTAAMIGAWDWCVTHQNDNPAYPIMVISTSFGGGRYYSAASGDAASPGMTTAAGNAVAAGITVLASSGNDGYCDSMGWPAAISSVISVGAVYDASFGTYYPCVSADSCAPKASDSGCSTGWYATDATTPDRVTSYSNTASFLTLLAPSNRAYTTDIVGSSGYASGDYYSSFGGTSAACPYAAGAVACLQSAAQALLGRYLTVAEVRSVLTSTGVNITDPKVAITKPRVNLDAAVDFLSTMALSSFGWNTVSSP